MNTLKLIVFLALGLSALAFLSTPAMAQDCDAACEYARGGHEPVVIILCQDCPPPFDCTPEHPCNCGGEDNPCPTAAVSGNQQVDRVRIPLSLVLLLSGRL